MSVFGDLLSRLQELDRELIRNIKSIRASQDLLDDLSTAPSDWQAGHVAISRVRPPAPLHEAVIHRPFDYGSVITFPFLPHNWQTTRFSDGLYYGVWYGSFTLRTTIYETVYHWLRFIEDAFPAEPADIIGERRTFSVKAKGLLADLRGRETDHAALIDPDDYRFCQELGRYAVGQRINGLLIRSARCNGINTALFNSALLGQVRDYCYLTYSYRPGSAQIRIEREPDRLLFSIDRKTLIQC